MSFCECVLSHVDVNEHLFLVSFPYFAAGHATESFSDFVVGHGELWSAQMLSYVIRKVC